jgi:hypothetical protein
MSTAGYALNTLSPRCDLYIYRCTVAAVRRPCPIPVSYRIFPTSSSSCVQDKASGESLLSSGTKINLQLPGEEEEEEENRKKLRIFVRLQLLRYFCCDYCVSCLLRALDCLHRCKISLNLCFLWLAA